MNSKIIIGIRMPPFVMGAAGLFWGLMTDQLILGVVLALVLEGHRLLSARWEVSEPLLTQLWQLSLLLSFVTVVTSLIRSGFEQMMYDLLRWSPLTMLPLILAQLYSTWDGIPPAAFSVLTKRDKHKPQQSAEPSEPEYLINVEYPFLCFTLCAASAGNPEGVVYYLGAALLVGWTLLRNPHRPKRHLGLLGLCFLVVVGIGYIGQIGLHQFHLYVEQKVIEFFTGRNNINPNQAITNIGSVGKLKLSPNIVWRMRVIEGNRPLYLRAATYNIYQHGFWYNINYQNYLPVSQKVVSDKKHWQFVPDDITEDASRLRLRSRDRDVLGIFTVRQDPQGAKRRKRTVFLALPTNPYTLKRLKAETVEHNGLGAVRAVEVERGILDFDISFMPGPHRDMSPTPEDLRTSWAEATGLKRITAALELDAGTPQETLSKLSRFFDGNFTYSTYLKTSKGDLNPDETPLLHFLEKERSGHCEYFATATVLLLRAAGIPARYVTGYSVAEYHPKSQEYLIRGLHAHAWAQAWVDGRWQYVDNTPPVWFDVEEQTKSWMQAFIDWQTGFPLWFADWKQGRTGQLAKQILQWGALPVLLLYIWLRLFRGQRSRWVRKRSDDVVPVSVPGMDSEFFELEAYLAEITEPRKPGEPMTVWWSRIRADVPDDWQAAVDEAMRLHYRLRFDPMGLRDAERKLLAEGVGRCLELVIDRRNA